MASAGVVGMAEVIQPTSASQTSFAGSPAMWSFVWVGFAALVLFTLHMSLVGRARLWSISATGSSGPQSSSSQ